MRRAIIRLDFLGLHAFCAIVERGSFRLAAAHLNLSETALSHRVRKLETDMGTKLFDRGTRRISLTPDGAKLFRQINGKFDDLRDAVEQLKQDQQEKPRELAVGCIGSVVPSFLTEILPDFLSCFPDVNVRVCDNQVQEIDSLVRDGTVEFAISLAMAYRNDFKVTVLGHEPFVLVTPPSQGPTGHTTTWEELGDLPMVRINAKSDNRQIVDDAMAGKQFAINWKYEVRRVNSAMLLVEAGLASAAVPALALDAVSATKFKLTQLRKPTVYREICTIARKDQPLSALAAELHRMTVKGLGARLVSASEKA